MEIFARTHRGRVRADNEDCVDFDAALGIAVLADGMGGQNAGEVASRTAVETCMRSLRRAPVRAQDALAAAVAEANRAVHRLALERPQFAGMGTTLVAAAHDGDAVWVAHAGDSRAYRFAGRSLSRVTVDHSVVQSLVDAGLLTPAQARRAPNRHIVTRALGILEAIECDVSRVPLAAGDLLILCSDGLTDMLDDATIAGICLGQTGLGPLVDALVAGALEAGGLDNVSVVAMRP
jgi:protein phosphatase